MKALFITLALIAGAFALMALASPDCAGDCSIGMGWSGR